MFFMNGEPKSSVRIMLAKLRKPSPMNSGLPHLHLHQPVRSHQVARCHEDVRERSRSSDVRAELEETRRRPRRAAVRAAAPVQDPARANERRPDEQDHRSGDDRREDALEEPRADEGHADLEERADERCACA
jgi:hypothetical protein